MLHLVLIPETDELACFGRNRLVALLVLLKRTNHWMLQKIMFAFRMFHELVSFTDTGWYCV